MQLKHAVSLILLSSMLAACGGSGSDSDSDSGSFTLEDGSADTTTPDVTPDATDTSTSAGDSAETDTGATDAGTINSDADSGDTDSDSTTVGTANVDTDTADTDADTGSTDGDTVNTGSDGASSDDTTVVLQPPINDDAGSATSDGGQTVATSDDDADAAGTDDSTVDVQPPPISDDAGSATSDGGQTVETSDDAADATGTDDIAVVEEQPPISDDAGSATSDGGQTVETSDDTTDAASTDETTVDVQPPISDDAGSATSDGGQTVADDTADAANTDDTTVEESPPLSDGDAAGDTSDTDAANTDTDSASTDAAADTDADTASTDTDTADTDTGIVSSDADADSGNSGDDSVMVSSDNSNVITCCLQEDRTAPAPGTFLTSATSPVVSNRVADSSDVGPQPISITNNNSFPGLRFGDLLLLNNAFNSGNQQWDGWSQSISLNDGSPVTADVVWDWGLESQKFQPFETIAFPEIVYGTKSAAERSGTFAETGLPVEEADRPEIGITYSYNRTAGVTQAPLGENDTAAEAADSEHNVIIESFWHDSCDIVRNGSPQDNVVMEMLIWYYHGERLPSGPSDIVDTGVLIDGQLWTVYAKSSNFNFLAYVAEDVETAERQSGTINYSAFIQHMLDNDERYGVYEVLPTDCFANILFGPEVFQGAGSFTVNDFTITRQY